MNFVRALYDGYDEKLAASATRIGRPSGAFYPRMVVIPPGVDFTRVRPVPDEDAPPPEGPDEPPFWAQISRFLRNPRKPAILASTYASLCFFSIAHLC